MAPPADASIRGGERMRVAIGGFSHETNTFNPVPTTLERVRRDGVYLNGREVADYYRGTRSTMGGIVDGCAEHGIEAVPTYFMYHGPNTGLIDDEVVHDATARLVAGVRAARPEGVLLHLHGAGAAAAIPDPEAHILAAIRAEVGP